jgi:hypothetical protein
MCHWRQLDTSSGLWCLISAAIQNAHVVQDSQFWATPDWIGDGTAGPLEGEELVLVTNVVLDGFAGVGVGSGGMTGAVGSEPLHSTQYS